MNYTPLNGNVIIQKIKTGTLVVAGEDKDINAVLTGKVLNMGNPKNFLMGKEVQFIRGQSRSIKLDGEDYFLIQEDKLLIVRNK